MRILFIGNSHTYFNDMPHLFQKIYEKDGEAAEVTMLAHGGMGLDYHVQQEEVHFNIRFGRYDWIVLQHTAHPMGSLEAMYGAAEKLIKEIRLAGSRPLLYMTWEEKNRESYQDIMSNAYLELGKKYQVQVAPVGLLWWDYVRKHPEAEMYADDGQHASRLGSSLAAAVICRTLTGEEPVELDEKLEEAVQCAFRYQAERR